MNRLQKKCVIATAACHLLLLVILFLGPAFFWRHSEPDNLPMLKVIPSTAVDAALSSGVANPQPAPPPQQPQPQPPEPTPQPPTPEPVVTPPTPAPEPVQPVEPKPEETKPEVEQPDDQPSIDPTPAPKPKPKHTIDVDLTPVHASTHKTHHAEATAQEQEQADREARAEERRRAAALQALTSSLEHGLSGGTDVQMPGAGAASYANYGQIVKSMYYDAWTTPDNDANESASPKVRVVIARDGTVISAHIIESSGDDAVDASVQQALDRVTTIQPFPDGATESQRTYTIKFNLKAKRQLE